MRIAAAHAIALVLVVLALAGCARTPHPADWARVHEVTPPFLEHRSASDPALAADGSGRVALTFVTRDSGGGRDLWLAMSRDSGATFGAPLRVNRAPGRVSSYSESRPLPAWGPGGRLAVAWSELRADTSVAVDLVMRASADAGATLGPPVVVNDDTLGRPVYHGFPALAFLPDGALFAAWMDGRSHPEAEAETMGALFRALSLDGGRTWSPNALVTDSLCPCCRASVSSFGDERLVLTYRSAAHGVRDPVLAFSVDGGRTFAPERPLADDQWRIEACPSDGPVLAAAGGGGTSVWTTGADPAGVYLASWTFGRGATGLRRALLDRLTRAAHPRAVPLGSAALVAVEALPAGDSVTVIAVRALESDGALTPWVFLGAHARDAWLAPLTPRAALAAWVEREGTTPRIRLARLERVLPR